MIPSLLVDALATFRLTRLVVEDQLTAPIRDDVIRYAYETQDDPDTAMQIAQAAGIAVPTPGAWATIVENDPNPPKLAYLVTCKWCASVWVAFGVVVLRRLVPKAWRPLAEALALSAVAGLVSEAVEK